MQDELGADGFVVLALSDEEPEKVSAYLDENGYTVRTASGTRSNREYGVAGIPAAVLIDPKGTIVWRGHPGNLSKGAIKDALKGARKGAAQDFFAFDPALATEHGAALAASSELRAAVDLALAGKLARAQEAGRKIAADAAGNAALVAGAQALVSQADAHAALLASQAEDALKRLDVQTAVRVFEALAKEMADQEAGRNAQTRLAEIKKDQKLAAELEAAESFERAKRSAERLATSKQIKKYEEFAEKYAGTRAGTRARNMARNLAK